MASQLNYIYNAACFCSSSPLRNGKSRTRSQATDTPTLLRNENFRFALFLPLCPLLLVCGCEFFKFLIPLSSPSLPAGFPNPPASILLAEFLVCDSSF
ncbi:hypothetical protein SLEP1_g18943 [Rubroshorea leprosula]|uniref:Uncharacterized protein n=1 Tax=Rubroshorea leprosula TaxID=152421 RepID=A0AAV5IZ71_9ROSI|nr:hypothetical protein SLEP1_g18943 [Rubroshorea leprosula]